MARQLCECGCGAAPVGHRARFVRGHAPKGAYCKMRRRKIGDLAPHPEGYVLVYVGFDYEGNHNGWMLQHRYVMEQHIGRPLAPGEQVHHVNRQRADNRLANLQLVTISDHRLRELAQEHGIPEDFTVDVWSRLKIELATEHPDVTVRELAVIIRAYDDWLARHG
jgi:hypothetical protein